VESRALWGRRAGRIRRDVRAVLISVSTPEASILTYHRFGVYPTDDEVILQEQPGQDKRQLDEETHQKLPQSTYNV